MKHQVQFAVYLTFAGNCRDAFNFYHQCFGGNLIFQDLSFDWTPEPKPVLEACLSTNFFTLYGSDLVHQEGRQTGNQLAICLNFKSLMARNDLVNKLEFADEIRSSLDLGFPIIELVDPFQVRWLLACRNEKAFNL